MFSKLTKKVNLDNCTELIVNIGEIKAQYNPDRFSFWRSLHEGPEIDVLNMMWSPHYRFLRQYVEQKGVINEINKTAYYRLQSMYGRNAKWIQLKVDKFINLFNSVRKNGFKENVIILNKPLVNNEYNSGFEIFEGHHRIACGLVLNIDSITCDVIY